MIDFLIEVRRLESSFDEGLWADQILEHVNPQIDFAGADYYGFDKIINGYKVQFNAPATRVDLIGSNNNIADVLISNGITVVPSNTAGGQRISVGSGLDTSESAKLSEIHDRLDLNVAKPNTYQNDGNKISNADWDLDKTDNGNGSSTVQRS